MIRATHPSDRVVAEVAWQYYVKGLTQGEIAKAMGLSRPTVISYLKLAKDRQIVGVKIEGRHFAVNSLADRLVERFPLTRAYVVPTTGTELERMLEVCDAAAHLLPSFVKEGDVLGVSWGTTVHMVSGRVPWWPVKDLVVRQLIGSLANPLLPTCEACTTEIARRLSATCINLNAPAICSRPELAADLRAEPIIAEQLERLGDCNKAIYSLSQVTADTHVVKFALTTPEAVASYRAAGAVGIISGRYIDANGDPVLGPQDERMIAADQDLLRSMEGLLVAIGSEKAEAARAVLTGGYAHTAVLEQALAEAILDG